MDSNLTDKVWVLNNRGKRVQQAGSIVSRTSGAFAIVQVNEGYSVTHVPSGVGFKAGFKTIEAAKRFARLFFSSLNKDERRLLKSNVPLVLEQLAGSRAVRRFF